MDQLFIIQNVIFWVLLCRSFILKRIITSWSLVSVIPCNVRFFQNRWWNIKPLVWNKTICLIFKASPDVWRVTAFRWIMKIDIPTPIYGFGGAMVCRTLVSENWIDFVSWSSVTLVKFLKLGIFYVSLFKSFRFALINSFILTILSAVSLIGWVHVWNSSCGVVQSHS